MSKNILKYSISTMERVLYLIVQHDKKYWNIISAFQLGEGLSFDAVLRLND